MLTPDCENSFIYAPKSRECQLHCPVPSLSMLVFLPTLAVLILKQCCVSSDVAVVDSSISINK